MEYKGTADLGEGPCKRDRWDWVRRCPSGARSVDVAASWCLAKLRVLKSLSLAGKMSQYAGMLTR
jgi:hypothetical protein